MQKHPRLKKILIGGFVVVLILFVTRPVWIPRLYYVFFVTYLSSDSLHTVSQPYTLGVSTISSDLYTFKDIRFHGFPASVVRTDHGTSSMTLRYEGTPTPVIFIALGASLHEGEMFGDAQTNYERARMIWSADNTPLSFWNASRDTIFNSTRLTIKRTMYGKCAQLLEFENPFGMRGIMCIDTAHPNNTIVTFFDPSDTQYELLLFNIPSDKRDAILGSIKPLTL